MSPEARVFRPKSETEDLIIDKLLEVHQLERDIQKRSWTQYVSWLMNRDLMDIKAKHKSRIGR